LNYQDYSIISRKKNAFTFLESLIPNHSGTSVYAKDVVRSLCHDLLNISRSSKYTRNFTIHKRTKHFFSEQ